MENTGVKITNYKVDTLPTVGMPNARYYLRIDNKTKVVEYLTDKEGNYMPLVSLSSSNGNSEITEVLIGDIDNNNATFKTTYAFYPESTLVFINGIKQRQGTDYTNTGVDTIVFTESPQVGDYLEINYIKF